MPSFFLNLDQTAGWMSLLAIAMAYLLKIFLFPSKTPYLSFSFLQGLILENKNRSAWTFLPKSLQYIACGCFILAFIDPHFMIAKSLTTSKDKTAPQANQETPVPTEGIAIYLVLDQSGSMAQQITTTGLKGRKQSLSKIDLLKQVTQQFIKDQTSNLIGLVGFARIPYVLVPLTLDQETLQNALNEIEVVKTQEEDGTAIGYAIFKTAHLIAATRHFAEELRSKGKPAYEIKGAAIIVVTDGFQDPSFLDKGNRLRTIELDDVATYVKNQGIHLYIINVDPNFASPDFAPHRRQMQEITEMTGGKYYLLSEGQDLKQVYTDIEQIEKGIIQTDGKTQHSSHTQLSKKDLKSQYRRFSFYPLLIALGLLCLLVSIILETTLLRRVP